MDELFDLIVRIERLERHIKTMQREIDTADHCRGCPVRDEFDQVTTKETIQPKVELLHKRSLTAQEVAFLLIVVASAALIVLFLHVVII